MEIWLRIRDELAVRTLLGLLGPPQGENSCIVSQRTRPIFAGDCVLQSCKVFKKVIPGSVSVSNGHCGRVPRLVKMFLDILFYISQVLAIVAIAEGPLCLQATRSFEFMCVFKLIFLQALICA